MNEKSILEQALLQVQTLEEAVKTNAKGILASTMKQEINDLLKEEEEEEVVSKQYKPKKGGKDVTSNFDEDEETEDDEEIEDEDSEDDEEIEDEDLEDDNEIEDEEMDDEEMDDEDLEMGFNPDDEDSEMGGSNPFMGGQGSDMGNDKVFDATEASSEDVLRIFKSMKPEDGFIVKKEGNTVEFKDGDNEYIIKLNENEDSMYDDMYEDEDMYGKDDDMYEDEDMYGKDNDMYEDDDMYGKDDDMDEDDVVYEIDLDGSDEYGDEEGDVQKLDATEAARTKWNAHGNKGGSDRLGIKGKKIFAAGAINEEMNKLKKQNSEYRKALVLFKEKLNEVAVFNANLAYSTRLFTEHSTTKKEKINILKRFDSVSTLKESKNLYSIIKTDLENKKPISESVVNRLNSTPSTSSSTQVLSESKAYENPQFRRMKDLMSKIK